MATMITHDLALKGLSVDQYEDARKHAEARVKTRIGDCPVRDQFKRELASIWTPIDSLALVVFMAALIISSAHIIAHMGKLADDTFANVHYAAGIIFSEASYTLVHQLGMIALAESSMLLFMVLHGITKDDRAHLPNAFKHLSVPLLLAVIAAVFVFLANLQSGIGFLESVMPPIFTIGIGLRLEYLIVDLIERRKAIDAQYLQALDVYERASADPTAHPDYFPLLRQAVWEKLIGLPSNRVFKDAPAGVKAAAVRREIERDRWVYDPPEEVVDWQPERPTIAATEQRLSTGSSVLIPDARENMQITPPVSVPTVSVNGLDPLRNKADRVE